MNVADSQLEGRLDEYLGIALPARTQKPRTSGLTMVMDIGWPVPFVEGMLDLFGDYLDVVKFWDPHLRSPLKEIERKVRCYRDHGVRVQPGGIFIEIAEAQGSTEETLNRLSLLGFNLIELSSTATKRGDADLERTGDVIRDAQRKGFDIFGEVGKKFFVGDETRSKENEIDEEVTIRQFKTLLSLGAEKVYWEGHLLRKVMGDSPDELTARRASGTAQIQRVVEAVGRDSIIFEVSGLVPLVSRRSLQFWLVRTFGPDVNIGNARLEEMGNLEALRSGSHPVFGFGETGNYPWLRSLIKHGGKAAAEWWVEDPLEMQRHDNGKAEAQFAESTTTVNG